MGQKIIEIKNSFGNELLILGHHYQTDEVLNYCDARGDSFELAKIASTTPASKIIFCGVHFMAETADIITNDEQKVFIPDPTAGCSLADCANIDEIESVWKIITSKTDKKIIPITYINSTAAIKAFTGKHEGLVCTSSNAEKALKKALELGDKVFFFPDQFLGYNTAIKMGFDRNTIKLWMKDSPGLTTQNIQDGKILLWDGYCCVHQEFSTNYIKYLRKTYEGIKIIAHPECHYTICEKSDYTGSTKKIIEVIEQSTPGSIWGVGTEKHLVNRLQKEHPDKEIYFLEDYEPECVSMMKITVPKLLYLMEHLKNGKEINRVIVDKSTASEALLALNRMLEL